MGNYLDIDLYFDGFNVGQVNCIDLPIAGAAGLYRRENYFYHCFYFGLFVNWTDINETEFYEFRNDILAKLGLTIHRHKIETSQELFTLIRTSIDHNIPVVFYSRYKYLFYSIFYMDDNVIHSRTEHGLLATGYDAERSIFQLRDIKVLDSESNPGIEKFYQADPLYKLQLTERMVDEIWTPSNDSFRDDTSFMRNTYHNTALTIERSGEPLINNYRDIIREIVSGKYNLKNNKLVKRIGEINDKYLENMKKSSFPHLILRRRYCLATQIIFAILEKAFDIPQSRYKDQYYSLKEGYILFRDNLLSVIYAYGKRGKRLEDQKVEKMIADVLAMDERLFELIQDLDGEGKYKDEY